MSISGNAEPKVAWYQAAETTPGRVATTYDTCANVEDFTPDRYAQSDVPLPQCGASTGIGLFAGRSEGLETEVKTLEQNVEFLGCS
jgi:hypothetical protein